MDGALLFCYENLLTFCKDFDIWYMQWGVCMDVHILTGHLGSGKTEVAVNFAIQLTQHFRKSADPTTVALIDIDVVNPYFGYRADLDVNDWQAPADANATAYFLADPGAEQPMVSTDFNTEGLSLINTNGKTQFKFYFESSMNNDANIDCLGFYSGEYSDPGKRPKLEISYTTTRTPIMECHNRTITQYNNISIMSMYICQIASH